MCQKGPEGRLSEHIRLYGVILKCKHYLNLIIIAKILPAPKINSTNIWSYFIHVFEEV